MKSFSFSKYPLEALYTMNCAYFVKKLMVGENEMLRRIIFVVALYDCTMKHIHVYIDERVSRFEDAILGNK